MNDPFGPVDDERVELRRSDLLCQAFFALEQTELRHRRFAGGWSSTIAREVYHIGAAVAALPYDPVRDQVVMIEQFRAGAMRYPEGGFTIEPVAGLKEPGESDERCARRETLEEAGLEARRIERIGLYAASPGAVDERAALYVVEVDAGDAGGIYGLEQEGEETRVVVFSSEEAFRGLDAGRFLPASAQLTLWWLRFNRDALRERWR